MSAAYEMSAVGASRAGTMERLSGVTQSLLRIFAAGILICPGGMKLFGWFGGIPGGGPLPPLMVFAGVLELVGGTLLLLGFFTRPVAFVLSGEMAFAYFMGHFPHGFWPIVNHGEPAVLLCFIFLFLSTAGAGSLSLDHLIRRRRSARG